MQALFSPSANEIPTLTDDYLVQLKARFVRIVTIGGLVMAWALVVLSFIAGEASPRLPFILVLVNVVTLYAWPATRNPRFVTAAALVTVIAAILISFLNLERPGIAVSVGGLAILAAAFLLSRTTFIAINIIMGTGLLVHFINVAQASDDFVNETTPAFVALGVFFVVSATGRYFSSTLQRFVATNRRTTDLLQAAADVGQITGKILEREQLFIRAVELIRDRFAYYHVQIFLVDEERRFANLVASTGDVGQELLKRQHRLAIGSQSVIGRVTRVGEPVIARDTDRDPLHARNELLPNTRSELALPILDGDRIIGALDVQSTRSNAFKQTDVQALQIMANQLGTAIRNADLFEGQAASLAENKRLFFELETRLREIQSLNRRLTQKSWDDYLSTHQTVTGVTAGETLETHAEWSDAMLEAGRRRRPILDVERGVVTVPIVLRGQVIGAMEVATAQMPDDDDSLELMQSVAQRLALSLDNARLFEEAQATTLQEQRLNQIVTQYQAAPSVDDLLKITMSELQQVFGAAQGSIRLGIGALPGVASENGSATHSGDGPPAVSNGHDKTAHQANGGPTS